MEKSNLSKYQQKLFHFLKQKEKKGITFTAQEIATATGHKLNTVHTNLSKGYWDSILRTEGKNRFRADNISRLSDKEFQVRISQSKKNQSFAHDLKYHLSKALVARSRDNMILAIELYNRPSLINRIDGFVLLFCTAWEQLLKAILIEKNGEDSIFKPHKIGKARESISLTQCIAQGMQNDKVKKNLEEIQWLRNNAAHLLVPEIQPIVVKLFQAGIFNYIHQYYELIKEPFLQNKAAGLLTLNIDSNEPTVVNLINIYGEKSGNEMHELYAKIKESIANESSRNYAIPIEYSLRFSRKTETDDINLAIIENNDAQAQKVMVVEKPVDHRKTHPYKTYQVISIITERVKELVPKEMLSRYLPGRKHDNPTFSSHDFQAILWCEKWKNNSQFYYEVDTGINKYSEELIAECVKKICKDPDYLSQVRQKYRNYLKKPKLKK